MDILKHHSHSKTLRDYQKLAVNSSISELIAGRNNLIVLPTASGKSVIISEIVFKSIKRVLILVNKISLLNQMREHIPYAGRFYSKIKENERVIIATVQSLGSLENNFDLIIFDEAHTITERIESWIGGKLCLGVTATPYTSQGFIYGNNKFFKTVSFERTFKWAINSGFLIEPKLKRMPESFDVSNLSIRLGDYVTKELEQMALDHKKMIAQVSDALPRLQDRKKVVWACVSINHAEALNKVLLDVGERSIVCHSRQDEFDISEFTERDAKHLVFVTIISTGFDYPPIDAVVLMRPTRSAVMMIQTIGRGLRLFEGKKDCTILDYGCVIENCGTPSNPILNFIKSKKKNQTEIKMKFCPKCLEYLDQKEKKCQCGHEFISDNRDILKNLTEKSFQNDTVTFKAKFYKQYKYKSKSGKIMDRIDYHTTCFMIISEFFRKRFIKDEGVCDVEIDCRKEGKYFKVVRVRNTKSDS